MKQAIETVIDLLAQIRNAYAEMLGISEEKQKYIIKGNAQGLNEAVTEEWRMIREISELEESRMAAAASLQTGWGMSSLTVSELVKRVDPQHKKKLEKISTELKNTIAAQKKVNAQNMELLRLHFEYMNFIMSNFLQEPQLGDIYGQSGVITESGRQIAGIIDSQV